MDFTVLSQRKRDLLNEVGNAFRDGSCLLLDSGWLSDNNVTVYECMELAELIHEAVDDFLKTKIVIRG